MSFKFDKVEIKYINENDLLIIILIYFLKVFCFMYILYVYI